MIRIDKLLHLSPDLSHDGSLGPGQSYAVFRLLIKIFLFGYGIHEIICRLTSSHIGFSRIYKMHELSADHRIELGILVTVLILLAVDPLQGSLYLFMPVLRLFMAPDTSFREFDLKLPPDPSKLVCGLLPGIQSFPAQSPVLRGNTAQVILTRLNLSFLSFGFYIQAFPGCHHLFKVHPSLLFDEIQPG